MKGKRLLPLILLMLFILPVSALAHPGGTDTNGGHYDGSEYHYHHGYPAHQHTNGVCPYDSNDETGDGYTPNSASVVPSKSGRSYIGGFLDFSFKLVIAAPIMLIIVSVVFRRKRIAPYLFFFSALAGCPLAWGSIFGLYNIDLPDFVDGVIVFITYLLLLILFRGVWDDSCSYYGRFFPLYRTRDCSSQYCRYANHSFGSYGCVEIGFTKDADSSSKAFRRALFDAANRYPEHSQRIVFQNLCPVSGSLIDAATPLYFDLMDFSAVHFDERSNLLLSIESLEVPSRNIVLSPDVGCISFPGRMTDILSICIPSDSVISCYSVDRTVYVNSELSFFVPKDLISRYEASESWLDMRFVDEDGEAYTPVFSPYYR